MKHAARLARSMRHGTVAVCLSWVAAVLPAAAQTAATPITPAEQLIFTTNHLHGITPQTELDYALGGAAQPAGKADLVRVLVVSADNAKGDAQVSDRNGAASLPSDGLPCNPVIIYFLEHDIAKMAQLTGGQKLYFQKRLRMALAAGPQVTTVTSQVNGRPVRARQIVIRPYLNDPNAARFPKYTGKRYTFVFAESVPGQVTLIRTDVPGPDGDFAHPLDTDTLSFQAVMHDVPRPPGKTPMPPPNAPRASR